MNNIIPPNVDYSRIWDRLNEDIFHFHIIKKNRVPEYMCNGDKLRYSNRPLFIEPEEFIKENEMRL